MNCDYIFELKDKNKILSKFSRNVELLIDTDRKIYVCCSGKVLSDSKCKRHIGKESIIDIRTLNIVRDISQIQGDIKTKITHFYVTEIVKEKCEKILTILNSKKEIEEQLDILPRITLPQESPRTIQDPRIDKEKRSEITPKTQQPQPQIPNSKTKKEKQSEISTNSKMNKSAKESILSDSASDYLSDTFSDSDKGDQHNTQTCDKSSESDESDVELELILLDDGKEVMINDRLEIIDLDEDGYGFVVGRLILCDKECGRSVKKGIKKDSKKEIIYNGNKYLIEYDNSK